MMDIDISEKKIWAGCTESFFYDCICNVASKQTKKAAMLLYLAFLKAGQHVTNIQESGRFIVICKVQSLKRVTILIFT